MGCSYDIFTGTLKQKEYIPDFVQLWNSVLEDDLYDDWALMDKDRFEKEKDGYHFGIDSEPLFCTMENGDQVERFLIEFFKLHPDAEFIGDYECTFNNCGDMCLKNFTYSDGVIHVKALYSEEPYVEECPECGRTGEDGDDLFSMHDWEEDKPFICPECGYEIEMDVGVDEYDIDVNTGEYTFYNEDNIDDEESED